MPYYRFLRMKKNLLSLFSFTFWFIQLFAQPALGKWGDYLPYQKVIAMASNETYAFAVTPYAVLSIEKETGSIQRINKLNYLSDIGISTAAYSEKGKFLAIGYINGNIDLLFEDNLVINVPDLKRSDVIGNKNVFKFEEINDHFFICTGLGILDYNPEKREVIDSYFLYENNSILEIHDIELYNQRYYVTTNKGVYSASVTAVLSNPTSWLKLVGYSGESLNYSCIIEFNEKLYFNHPVEIYNSDTVYAYDGFSTKILTPLLNLASKQFSINSKNQLVVCHENSITTYANDFSVVNNIYTVGKDDVGFWPLCFDFDITDGVMWIGDRYLGAIRNTETWVNDFYSPNSYPSVNVWNMDILNGELWVSPGAITSNWGKTYLSEGIHVYQGSKWSTIDRTNSLPDSISDLIDVCVNSRKTSESYAASYGYGVLKFENNEFVELYTPDNSGLESRNVSAMTFDNAGNLWMVVAGIPNMLTVKTPDDEWFTYDVSSVLNEAIISDVVVDDNGTLWGTSFLGKGLLVFNPNGTFDDTSDDDLKLLGTSAGQGGINNLIFYSIVKDKSNAIWVGCDEGVSVFYSPGSIFSSSPVDAQRIYVQQGVYTEYLLASESVTAMAVDGANRKWLGTKRSGIFLVSEDGTEEIHHFTEENSPLLSNEIKSIAIDDLTGEVFIATLSGMVSFRSDATNGFSELKQMYAYPNPVEESFEGSVAINGLQNGAQVTITDIAGNLVHRSIAIGGTATWNRLDLNDKEVTPGIYVVHAISEDGIYKGNTKILIQR